MQHFFTSQADFSSKTIRLTNTKELHHIKNVLRLKKGDRIFFFNDSGEQAEAVINELSSQALIGTVQNIKRTERQKPEFILACAMPKKSKFETIIEKATEMGVDEIYPLLTKRTEVKIAENKLDRKYRRFEEVALHAAKQTGRNYLPIVHPAVKFEAALNQITSRSTTIIPSLKEKKQGLIASFTALKPCSRLAFLIGPEGDFTDAEYRLAAENGAIAVTLGKNILKVETAALCVLACALQHFRTEQG